MCVYHVTKTTLKNEITIVLLIIMTLENKGNFTYTTNMYFCFDLKNNRSVKVNFCVLMCTVKCVCVCV